jgi:hypothetical protein
MKQPPQMANPQYLSHVCKLQKAFYGLKQAPCAWFDQFSTILLRYGFFYGLADLSLIPIH